MLDYYRNKGLGYAISHKPLLDARNRGFKQTILLASSKGRPLYNRIGFKEYASYHFYGNY